MKIKLLICLIIFLFSASILPTINGTYKQQDYNIIIEDDYSFPQKNDYDFRISESDIHIDISDNNNFLISAMIYNKGLCQATAAHGWYSSNGRSCWGEWDFEYPSTATIDIQYRCYDDAKVDWRVELDGGHIASPSVPGIGSNNNWKLVTIEDVQITEGFHTLFLGTYQMDFGPDYHVDWIKIGDLKIEAETYDRSGGNDPNEDLRGLSIWPRGLNPPENRDLKIQIWQGNPFNDGILLHEDFVGDTNTVIDRSHCYPGYNCIAHYLKNNDFGEISFEYTNETLDDEIYIVIDPKEVLKENDEGNNIAHSTFKCQDAFMIGTYDERIANTNSIQFKAKSILYVSRNPREVLTLKSGEEIIVSKESGYFLGNRIIFGNFRTIIDI